jgi:hypothetical protein
MIEGLTFWLCVRALRIQRLEGSRPHWEMDVDVYVL